MDSLVPPPDLPISSGPWKFYGFPGLILKAEDTTGTHRFEAYSLLEGKGLTINEVSDVGGIKRPRGTSSSSTATR